jgi:hypothetical protein
MKKINLSLITIFISLFMFTCVSNAQNIKIKWSEESANQGDINYRIIKSNTEYYLIRAKSGFFNGQLTISSYKENNLIKTEKVEIKTDIKNLILKDIEYLNDKLVAFYENKDKELNTLYVVEFDEKNLKLKNKLKKINEYNVDKKGLGFFNYMKNDFSSIVKSDNKVFFAQIYEQIDNKKVFKKEYKYSLAFKVFDNEYNEISSGAVNYNQDSDKRLLKIHLSSTGDLFLLEKDFKNDEYVITQCLPEEKEEFIFTNKDKYFDELEIKSNEKGIFLLTGIYKNDNKGDNKKANNNGAAGVYSIKIDFNKKEIISEGHQAFDKKFLEDGMTDKELKKMKKRKMEPGLINYEFKGVEVLKNGSFICVLEQYYLYIIERIDPKTGVTTSTYQYYYNDVVSYKIDNDCKIDWIVKIPKKQISVNDAGRYSSITYFIDENSSQLYVLFNDNIKSYNEKKEFTTVSKQKPVFKIFDKSCIRSCVAIISVDLNNGDSSRKIAFTSKEVGATFVPKRSFKNSDNQFIIYGEKGNKEKLGLINL